MSVEQCSLDSPCNDSVWHVDETKTLEIEVNGQTLSPRRCELRHIAQFGIAAVKFAVEVNEIAELTSEEALTWRCTVRKGGTKIRQENGWRIAAFDEAGESKVHLCLEPV